MARKAFLATDAMREKVRSLAGRGVRQEDIAKIVECDAKTLRKHFRSDLDRGMAEANAKVAGYLFDAAEGGFPCGEYRKRWGYLAGLIDGGARPAVRSSTTI